MFAADSWFLLFSTSKGMPACGIPCKHSRNLSLLAGISTSRTPCRVRVPVRTRRGRHAGSRYFFYSAAILKRLTQELDVQPPCLFRSAAYSEIKPNLSFWTFVLSWDIYNTWRRMRTKDCYNFVSPKKTLLLVSASHLRKSMPRIFTVLKIFCYITTWGHVFQF